MPGTVGRPSAAPLAKPAGAHSVGPFPPAGSRPWRDTPLGPPDRWDPALRSVIELVLTSPVAMSFAYGEDLALIYNDGYAALIGGMHPAAFGRPAAEVFAEAWHEAGMSEVIRRVLRTGEPYRERETLLPLTRAESGRIDPAVFTGGHSAVRDGQGRIIGMLTVTAETTQMTPRLQRLSELAAALSDTLTLDDVVRVALRNTAAAFDADQVAFGVDDGGGWRTVRRIRNELLDEVNERLPPLWRRHPADSPAPLVRTAAGGPAIFAADGQPLAGAALDRHDQTIRALAVLRLRTPSLRGALAVGYQRPHSWSTAERALLAASAELVAQAAQRARRLEAQHGTSQLLQRSMLPKHLPDLPQMRIAARYDAGTDSNAAGGDFYDSFRLPGGRLAVVLGDVAGHDVQAAALMGQVRAALRALALTDPNPGVVLTGLDRLVQSLGVEARSDELFVTVCYGVIDPDTRRLTLSSAGHPAPVLRRVNPGGPATASFVEVPPCVPLGLGGGRGSVTVDFPPGDTLLLYSDGVVKRRGQGLPDGLAALAAAVAAAPSGAPRALCAVATAAVAGATEDDVAVLAVEHAVTPSRSAGLEVPAEPIAPGRVRHWLAAQLAEWEVPEAVIGSAVLCASELTTNALLHAGTAARVEIELSPQRLLVSVADSGNRGTVTRARTDALSGRGHGLGLIEQLSDEWGTDSTVRGSTVWFEILIPPTGGSVGL